MKISHNESIGRSMLPDERAFSLLDLYVERRIEFLADLGGSTPGEAAEHVSNFVCNLPNGALVVYQSIRRVSFFFNFVRLQHVVFKKEKKTLRKTKQNNTKKTECDKNKKMKKNNKKPQNFVESNLGNLCGHRLYL